MIPDPPIHGTREAIARLRKVYRVVVHSTRCRAPEGCEAIKQWLARHGIEVDEVCEHKPPAVVYVDDRAVPFRGDWEQVTALLEQGRLEPVVDRTYPLEEAAAAQERMARGEQFGKIVLEVPPL